MKNCTNSQAKNQAFNPYLPSCEYIPDGEPYVFGERLYIYGSHDMFDGPEYCHKDYVCWSAHVDDLSDWRYEGVIYKKTQDPMNPQGKHCLYAPDVTKGPDGRFYLYYGLDRVGITAVAVCDTPAGAYEFLGYVKRADGSIIGKNLEFYQFDPGIFIDDDGRIFLYTGFAPRPDTRINAGATGGRPPEAFGSYFFELENDMLTTKHPEPKPLIPVVGKSQGTGFEGHEYFEASSMRKINGKYYLVYSSINSHELCYAVSDRPDGGFEFGGTLVSIGDVYLNGRTIKDAVNYMGNTHGGLVKVKEQWYIFYHRQTNLHQYSRQACAEKVFIQPDGSIKQAEITSCGLNPTPLAGIGTYEARIACNLIGKDGCTFYSFNEKSEAGNNPYFTQNAPDCEPNSQPLPKQYIANISDGATIGFKYFHFIGEGENAPKRLSVTVCGNATGKFQIFTAHEKGLPPIAEIEITPSDMQQTLFANAAFPSGKHALFFTYRGTGSFDFYDFGFSL
ncbi:MAG: family 43 glycosylhydrolase [Defluviitaleaceae bacterium]|nr:family 43 glycosylhydrolase [Defluviitaleaceae bacterium]